MKRTIDLRSDTFTLPDEGMRKAIYRAEVGNSAYGEDPSVNRLESIVADYFGMEAGLFLPSATMARFFCCGDCARMRSSTSCT